MEANEYQIFIKQSEKQDPLKIPKECKVSDIKILCKEKGITTEDPEKQRLIHNGRIVKDDEPISTYNIKDKSILNLILTSKLSLNPNLNQNPIPNANQGAAPGNIGNSNFPNMGAMPNIAGLGNMGALGGMGQMGAMSGLGGLPFDLNSLSQMMQSPIFQQMMQQFVSNPEMLRTMIQANPFAQSLLGSNPQAAAAIDNPGMLASMLNPQNISSGLQMLQGLNPNQPGPQVPTTGIPNPLLNQNAPNGNMPLNSNPINLPNIMNNPSNPTLPQSLGGMNPPILNQFNPPPEVKAELTKEQLKAKYASELQKLREMGYSNDDQNVEILKESNGNIEFSLDKFIK